MSNPQSGNEADDLTDENGRQPGDDGYNWFNKRSTNARHAKAAKDRQAAHADNEKRLQKWGARRYDAAILDRVDEAWARKIRSDIAHRNAMRDPMKTPPTLMFSGDYAAKTGATDAQIAALPVLSLDEIAGMRVRAAIELTDAREQIRTEANKLAAARAVAAIEIPGRINLATYTPPDTAWLVDKLVPMNGSLGLFAERKAGKTTTVVEMVRALLSGDKFLGRFASHLSAEARVALLDTEMTPAMLHREYAKVGVADEHLDRIDLHALRGRSRLLDLRDELTRSRWHGLIATGSVIVVDCLYTVLAAAQVDESSAQVSDIIDGIKALAVESDAAALVIVHHLGKDPSKGARGHSSIEGGVDTLATIWLDGPPAAGTPRLFSATGRMDVDVPAALLRRSDDNRLTLSDNAPSADRRKASDSRDDDTTWKLINEHSGRSLRGLEELPTETRQISRNRLRRAVDRLSLLGHVVNQGTDERPAWHAADRSSDPLTGPANRAN
jgi:AAA domain